MKRRLKIIAEDAGRPVKHFGPWILDFGLQNCTISAPFLHHFSRFSKSHPLIINHLQKKLHMRKEARSSPSPGIPLEEPGDLRLAPLTSHAIL